MSFVLLLLFLFFFKRNWALELLPMLNPLSQATVAEQEGSRVKAEKGKYTKRGMQDVWEVTFQRGRKNF